MSMIIKSLYIFLVIAGIIAIILDNMKKGLSPLLATVMLIALTLSVVGLIGSWFISMSRSQMEEIEERGETQIECTNALLDIVDVICSNSTEELKIAVNNIGQINLYDFSTFVEVNNTFYQNSTGGPNSTYVLAPGGQTILVYHCDKDLYCAGGATIDKVRITPSNCPQVYVEESVGVTCG